MMAPALSKVAFGCTLLDRGLSSGGIDGIGQYCQELLNQFSSHSEGISINPYTFGLEQSKSGATLLPNYTKFLMQSSFAIPGNSLANQFFESVDIIHATDQLIPIRHKKTLVSTVMDAIPLSHPEYIRTKSRWLKPFIWKKLTQHSDHIITISEFSKLEIASKMNFPLEKITSIPLGVDSRYFDTIPPSQTQAVLNKFLIDRPFLLFIGSIQPRKNLLRLLKAHATLPNNLATDFPLVIAGKLAWDDGKTLTAIQKGVLEKRCIWLNYVSDFEKRCLLQTTTGLAFTSLYEGFGLPILEAFASNAPVLTSDCTSMPEVAGDSAFIIDPREPDSIRFGLLSLLNDTNKRKCQQISGLERAKQFTWRKVAQDTTQVYKALL